MEKILTLRGLLFGAIGGFVAWVFMYIMAEPIIGRAIDYEGARSEAIEAIEQAHQTGGFPQGGEEEVFSRSIQEGLGAGTGMVLLGFALGGITAVIFAVWMHYRSEAAARRYALPVTGLTFAVLYLLPILKYPANPPAVGNEDTIKARTGLFLLLIVLSAVAVVIGVFVRQKLRDRLGEGSMWVAVGVVIVLMLIVYAVLPQLGSLDANAANGSSFETPGPVVDADGHIIIEGFDADDLYQFRLYSLIAQAIIYTSIAGGLTLAAKKIDSLRGIVPRKRVGANAS